jgi:hypothetical protein
MHTNNHHSTHVSRRRCTDAGRQPHTCPQTHLVREPYLTPQEGCDATVAADEKQVLLKLFELAALQQKLAELHIRTTHGIHLDQPEESRCHATGVGSEVAASLW